MDSTERLMSDSARFSVEAGQRPLVQHDYMTGLQNMASFFESAEAGCQRLQEQGIDSAIIFLDLMDMKSFNRLHGFAEGNRLLCAVANILCDEFGIGSCARFAQDHFAAFAQEDGLRERLDTVVKECSAANGGKTLPIRIGIYPNRIEAVEIATACDRARLAANVRKKRKKSYYAFFDVRMLEDEKDRQAIVDNLDRAIEEGWIQVYYQPIVRSTNGKVCDAEGLARWFDPARGMLSPATFIPVLEKALLIHKLDLYIVRQALRHLKLNEELGNQCVPISINFSRVDFDVVDLVSEICMLVDEAQVDRSLINIEITESVVGRNFEFMKEQVDRFRAQGFEVWMDDFGSGYSSLDLLQSLKFDLIKFDMGFLRRLDQGEEGKIILTEMMKMATSLGVDTVCEGVETSEQVRFLQEIGCSKLQGYYFMRPSPPRQIVERYTVEIPDGFEEPQEAAYFDTVGRVNLFDLSFLANRDDNVIKNTFDTVPMGIMEVSKNGDKVRYIRSNRSFRGFMKRAFSFDLSDPDAEYDVPEQGLGSGFMRAFERSLSMGGRAFVDERLDDGGVARSFLRRIGKNPLNGREAVAIAVLSVSEPDDRTTYAEIAQALAADYYNIYMIDLKTNDYVKYASRIGDEEMSKERFGEDFFEATRRKAMLRVYEPDRKSFLELFTKEHVLQDLDAQGLFTMTYRTIDTGVPVYVNVKITRTQDRRHLIMGVSNVDAHMRQLDEQKRLRQETISLSRIASLSPNYIVLYTVDPVTGHYTQYNPSHGFEDFGLATHGEDFFGDVRRDAPKAIAPEDMERHLRVLTRENMLREIRAKGCFVHNYRLLLGGRRVPASLKAILVQEEDGEVIILGVTDEEKNVYRRELDEAQKIKDLNAVITSLLDNMPGMTFTKDAQTGVYLTCNQAFAEYAHKSTPDGVVGLTDAEIFDEVTATHFVEDDRIALSREKPYLFFEDVPDAAGNQRQFQTTKLKYVDSMGRLCLQGMCQDVTDMIRIQRENVLTREAYEEARTYGIIYNHLAHALARGYTELYYISMETDEFIEFHTDDVRGVLAEARRGFDFFGDCARDARLLVHPEDRAAFLEAMSPQFLSNALEESKVFTLTYRRMVEGSPFYVQAQVSRMEDDGRFVVVAVRDVDELMKKRQAEERIQEERIIYARLHALSGNHVCVYVIDPDNGDFHEFSSTAEYRQVFDQASVGTDYFAELNKALKKYAHPDDQRRALAYLTQRNVVAEVERRGFFTLVYRVMFAGEPRYVQLRAAMVEEQEGPRLVVGLYDIDAQVRQEQEYGARLMQAQLQANTDALTGVKNKHAYLEEEARIDAQIAEGQQPAFAVAVFDVNDLKKVNDTAGHQAGDQWLRDACAVVCDIFKHSPVFRVGGDEFAVVAQNRDYRRLDELTEEVWHYNVEAYRTGRPVIACGLSRFEDDACAAAVFERADRLMYVNKNTLKSLGH